MSSKTWLTRSVWPSVCKRLWELVFPSSQLIIFKLMAKRNESTKFWKTCSVLVFFPMGSIGRNACHSPSFSTTIAFEPVSAGHLSRLYTEEGVEPRRIGLGPAKDFSLVQTRSMRPRVKSSLFVIVCARLNPGKRAMRIAVDRKSVV